MKQYGAHYLSPNIEINKHSGLPKLYSSDVQLIFRRSLIATAGSLHESDFSVLVNDCTSVLENQLFK